MSGEEGGQGGGRAKLRARGDGAERLCVEGGADVERVAAEDGKVVRGGLGGPLESKFGRVRQRLRGLEDAGEGVGEAWFGEAGERRVDVRERERR